MALTINLDTSTMPIYLHLTNLIIAKNSVAIKHKSNENQFKHNYINTNPEFNTEDNQLFFIAAMNPDELDILPLIDS
ncbi:MAG: hypothetical protein C0594_15935 [Marinilabiliales bacterium]|nr:MAG: hypothetical protein C0594_15935 [Marinilabiliales bacterium]